DCLSHVLVLADIVFCFFFFSSRRRHTRCLSDWSSDVCSSDLVTLGAHASVWYNAVLRGDMAAIVVGENTNLQDGTIVHVDERLRSEERRVGKECRSRWSAEQ